MTMPTTRIRAEKREFAVSISASLKRRLDLYLTLCPFEISGLGEVEVRDGVLTVTALHLLEQEGNAGHTVLSPEDQLQFIATAESKGIQLSNVRLWWHSHATHEVYWSPTDEATISAIGQPPWWLSIVGNHREEYLVRLDIFPTEELPLRLTEYGRLIVVHDEEEVDSVRKEIDEKVTEKKFEPPLSPLFVPVGDQGLLQSEGAGDLFGEFGDEG